MEASRYEESLTDRARFGKAQPLTYTVLKDCMGSTNGINVVQFKAGEQFTARTRGELSLMWEFERLGFVQIGVKALENKQAKVTRPSKTK